MPKGNKCSCKEGCSCVLSTKLKFLDKTMDD